MDSKKESFKEHFTAVMSKAPAKRKRFRMVPGYESTLDIEAQRLWQARSGQSHRLHALEDWWFCVPKNLRRTIQGAIRPYRTLGDLRRAAMTGPAHYAVTAEAGLWSGLQQQLPKVDKQEFMQLLRSPQQERAKFIDEFCKGTRAALKRFLQVKPHRARKNFERDWDLAKLMYEEIIHEDMKPSDEHLKQADNLRRASKSWNHSHPEAQPVTPAMVKTAISRIHNEFVRDLYERRLFAYVVNFPRIGPLTCPQCDGNGEVRNPDPIWQQWYAWRERHARDISNGICDFPGDPQPQPHGNGSVPCISCKGTGRKSPLTP